LGGDGLGDGGTEDRVAGGGRAAVSGDETGDQVGKVPSRLQARRSEGGGYPWEWRREGVVVTSGLEACVGSFEGFAAR
jgi:hypothetical protein